MTFKNCSRDQELTIDKQEQDIEELESKDLVQSKDQMMWLDFHLLVHSRYFISHLTPIGYPNGSVLRFTTWGRPSGVWLQAPRGNFFNLRFIKRTIPELNYPKNLSSTVGRLRMGYFKGMKISPDNSRSHPICINCPQTQLIQDYIFGSVYTSSTFIVIMNALPDRFMSATDPVSRNRCSKSVITDAFLVLFHLDISAEIHLSHGNEIL
ncbi:hypothetical protein TNCV_4409551 [Trichonephila clavipes]|nr:hypothetical protein TNCV_4409551 [Trichonephila clavipes]